MTPRDSEARFRDLYSANAPALTAYAARRVSDPADAADVVADTFLVAWRRLPEVPLGDEARLWLYGVARRTLANQRRGTRRREELGSRLRQELGSTRAPDADVAQRVDVQAALRKLGTRDAEVLTLTLWEELTPTEIAAVLGVSPGNVRVRLLRARARLRDLLGDSLAPPGVAVAAHPEPTPEETR